jgi:predicted RNA-binding protein with PUA-like domain
MVKTPTDGAHRGANRRDHWANLKDLFININPLKVVYCYFIHMHRRIDSSSSRLDPSANGSTTRFNLGLCRNVRAQQQRVRLLRLREEARWPANDYFDFARRLGGPPVITSTLRG